MLHLMPREVICLAIDVTRIDGLLQELRNPLWTDTTRFTTGETRIVIQKALDFGLGLEAAIRIGFKRFLDHRSNGFVPHEHFAQVFGLLKLMAYRREAAPKPHIRPHIHLLLYLTSVLLALGLALRGDHVFANSPSGVSSKLKFGLSMCTQRSRNASRRSKTARVSRLIRFKSSNTITRLSPG